MCVCAIVVRSLRSRPPSTAKHVVQGHEVGLARELRDDQALLFRVELALRVGWTQGAIDAGTIACVGQVVGSLRGRDEWSTTGRSGALSLGPASVNRIRGESCQDEAYSTRLEPARG